MIKSSDAKERVSLARKSFTTRLVEFSQVRGLLRNATPKAGDLLLARVDAIGQHTRLEAPTGRRAKLYPGDEIVVAYGARYAPDQFEAVVPESLAPCELVAGGGVAASVVSRHARISKATRIIPIGLLADGQGERINLAQFALPAMPVPPGITGPVIAVVGSSMNAGKTTTAAGLIHGLSRANLRVAGIKVTGTGSGGDLWSMADAGAEWVFDFTDMGHATTAGIPLPEVERITSGLVGHVSALGADVTVLEVADGLFQTETAGLLQSPLFAHLVDNVLFAAGDAMGAVGGVEWLRRHGLPLRALSGLITTSPLAMREAAANTDIPAVSLSELINPHFASRLCFGKTCQDILRVA